LGSQFGTPNLDRHASLSEGYDCGAEISQALLDALRRSHLLGLGFLSLHHLNGDLRRGASELSAQGFVPPPVLTTLLNRGDQRRHL
jgi:hypothetical protein